MKNKRFWEILVFLAHKKLTRILKGKLYRVDFGGFFTTSTSFIEHKKVRIVHVAICLRLNAKITGLQVKMVSGCIKEGQVTEGVYSGNNG